MILRLYKSEDCKEIIELFYNTVHTINIRDYNEAQVNVWAPKDIDSALWNCTLLEHYSIVCEKEGIIIGFGDIDKSGYLDRLYVHKDYQRCGVAAKIVETLEGYAKENNVSVITTDASITAKAFFERRGYEVIREQIVERKGQILKNFKMSKKL